MDIRFKKMFAGVSAAAIMLSQVSTALAAYSDVPAGVWYESAVSDFVERGILDSAQTRFRGTDTATRSEFFKLVVELNGGALSEAPAVPSFDDVSASAWYYKYIEEAAKEGWVRGDGSCYGKHPCYARPNGKINRAEAAATIVRAFGLESSGSASQFVDNPSGQWYTAAVQTAADSCVLQGDAESGRVRPSDNMNRAEMVVMLSRAEQNLAYGKDCGTVSSTEPSVKDAVAVSATVIEASFNVTLDETAAEDKSHYSISGALPVSSVKLTSSDTVEITVSKAMDAGAQYTLTVADMVAADGKKFSDSTSFSGYTTVVQGNGSLEVTLAAKNPVGDTIPKGAVGVVFTTLDLTAGQDDVTLENLVVLHEGFGSSADFSGVYALVDGARVTRKRTIDSQSYTASMRFTSPLVVRAGKTVTLQIAGDLITSATTAAEHALSVELPSDFVSNAKSVKGNFPLRGNTFRTAAVTSGVATIAYRSVTPSTIKVGDKAVSLGKWELTIDSTEDQTIYSMTVENDGTASDGDFTNLSIKRSDGTLLTKTVASTVSDFATLVFDPPFTILEGDRVTMTLIGDIKGGAAKNIKIHFDETADIFAVGSLYGYGVNGQLYGSAVQLPTESSTLPGTVSIDAGQFTIAVDGPVTEQYTRKDKNVVLSNVSFTTGGEDVDVEQLFILIEAKTSTGGGFVAGITNGGRTAPTGANEVHEALENVELRNTTTGRTISGVRLTSPSSAVGATSSGSFQVYRFDDFIIRGAEKYELRVNFIDNSGVSSAAVPANGDKFRAHICGEATHSLSTANELQTNSTNCALGGWYAGTAFQMKIKGVSTNDRVGDYRPGGTISGNFQEIRTAGLTVTGKATTTSETSVKNAKNVSFLRFEARANEAADVLITDLIFEAATSASLVNASNYALWVDTNDDGVVDTVLQNGVSAQSSKITFDKITGGGYVVAKQKSTIFEVHADIASSLVTSNPVLALRFATGSTYIQAEQVHDGSSLANISTNSSSSTAEIQVTTAYATMYTLRAQGDLFVTKSSTPVRSHQLLGGTLGDEIFRLQFHAEYEDIDVTDIVFSGSGANASTFATNVDRLELYTVGSSTPFAYATVGGCGTGNDVQDYSMCADMENQEFVVKKGADTNILVRPRVRTDVDGSASSEVVALRFDPTPSSTTGAVRARGLLSSSNLSANDGDGSAEGEVVLGNSASTANVRLSSNYNQVVHSKVTSITNADPNANGTAIPTGVRKLGQFKFSTAAASNLKNGTNKWTLSGVVFNVNATNVILGSGDQTDSSASDFKLYNAADSTQKSTCLSNRVTSSGTLLVTCRNLRSSTVSTEIDAGTDTTFVLEAEVANAKVSNSSTSTLQVSLQAFSETPTATTFGTASTDSHISWQDKDNSSTTTFRWIDYPETSVNGTSYNG